MSMQGYYGLGDNIKAFVGALSLLMFVTDVWVPLLFVVVFWLMEENKHRLEIIIKENKGVIVYFRCLIFT
jgi:hypothetical protein